MKKLLSAVTSVVMSASLMTGAFASSVSAAGSLTVEQPNISMGEVLDVSAKTLAADASVEWKLPTITAAPGQTVTMPIVVQGTGLEISGGQFVIKAASPIAFNSIVTGNAYGYEIASNADENTFLFSGVKGKVAADNSVIGTLKFTIPADCADGKYDVKWSESTASAPGGKNVTDKVKFTDGAINVKKDADEGSIEWVLDNVTAEPGQKVTLSAYVNNSEGSALGVAGGQFVIKADSGIKFDSVKDGSAYDAKIEANTDGTDPAFLFSKFAKEGVVAADKAEIMQLTYTIPADCAEGKYNVKWAEQTVSNGRAKNITSKVTFKDGSITVKKPNPDGKIKWILGNETAKPGDTVKVNAIVDDSANAAVAIAGAQFTIKSASKDIKLAGASSKTTAYDAAISSNLGEGIFMFGKPGSASVAAADGKTVATFEFKIDEKCAAGKYAIEWADTSVSNALSQNITANVQFVNGSITVGEPSDEDAISWVIPKVQIVKGTTSAELAVKVSGSSKLAIAGGQFGIDSEFAISGITGKPYDAELSKNENRYLFAKTTGTVVADGKSIMTLNFTIPADAAVGKYPVKWIDTTVSAEKGVNVTNKVKFVDGEIEIVDKVTTTVPDTTAPVTTVTTTDVTQPSTGSTETTKPVSETTKPVSTTGDPSTSKPNTTAVTTVSFPITTTTAAPVVIPEDKTIAWVVDNVYAYAGDEVKVSVKVFDPSNKGLAIGGAQFDMVSGANATLKAVGAKSSYGADIVTSDDMLRLMFMDGKSLHTAPDGSVVAELTYKVSENAASGEVIPVEIKNLVASGEKSVNIASQIYTVKGSITVLPKPDPVETSETAPVTTGTTTPATTAPETSTTTTGTTTSGTTKPVSTTSGTTTSGTTAPATTTTTGTTTSGTTAPATTTTTGTTTSGTTAPATTTTTGTTTSGTTKPATTTTTGTTTTAPVISTKAGFVRSYATFETEVGFYFSHDNGIRGNGTVGGFQRSQIKISHIYDVYEDGHKEEQTLDPNLINFNNVTPESAYNSRMHIPGNAELTDFIYDINVFYGATQLTDESGKAVTVTAYIGVKGDITLNNAVDSVDASASIRYYAQLSTGKTVSEAICQSTAAGLRVESGDDVLDHFAAFLGDVTENEWGGTNWITRKSGRVINAVDASNILGFYAKRSSQNFSNMTNTEVWDDVLGDKRYTSGS